MWQCNFYTIPFPSGESVARYKKKVGIIPRRKSSRRFFRCSLLPPTSTFNFTREYLPSWLSPDENSSDGCLFFPCLRSLSPFVFLHTTDQPDSLFANLITTSRWKCWLSYFLRSFSFSDEHVSFNKHVKWSSENDPHNYNYLIFDDFIFIFKFCLIIFILDFRCQ